MNHLKKQAAVKKYSEQFKTDPEGAKESLSLDYEPDEATEILNDLAEPVKKGQPKKHKNYAWFDDFDARIQKTEVRNRYTSQNETIITGWELQKKKHAKLIEPHNAVYLNSFADGYDTLGTGSILLEKDKYKTGDVIPYKEWAIEQGKDLKEDKNIFLIQN